MNSTNKETLKQFGKVVLFMVLVFAAIIVFAGVLNGITMGLDKFYGYVAALNLGVESYFFYKLYLKFFKKN